jgi:hypothetical protein
MHSCLQLAGPEKGWIILKSVLLYHSWHAVSNACLYYFASYLGRVCLWAGVEASGSEVLLTGVIHPAAYRGQGYSHMFTIIVMQDARFYLQCPKIGFLSLL